MSGVKLRVALAVAALLASLVVPVGLPAPPAAGLQLNQPVVGMAATPSGQGYWQVARDGGMFTFGDAPFLGSTGDLRLNSPIVGMAATPTGRGYWLVAADGGIFTFGDAPFLGSTGDLRLNSPIVGMAATPSGRGYWLVARDGGIFTFGDAAFLGSTGDLRLNAPIVGMAPSPSGRGYRVVATDGGIFTFGDATFLGSAGSIRLNSPVVGMASTPSGRGYWLVARDGGIFTFGDAGFFGSAGAISLNQPIVAMAATASGSGYWLVAADGGMFTYGDAGYFGSPQEIPAPSTPGPPPRTPSLSVTTVVGGLTIPWDLAFTPDGTMLFTERPGRLRARLGDGTVRLLADISGSLNTDGERGLLGMAIDPAFASNRNIYTCQSNRSPAEVRLVKWTVAEDYSSATRVADPLVGGIPSTSTLHNGCRPRFAADRQLYVGTGDSVQGPMPQSNGLGGKVLRVDPVTGAVAIHTRGHRNVQGLAFRPGTGQLYAVEHGPDRDDEVNLLRAGGNAGWDPNVNGSYNAGAPMTDLNKVPDAIRAVWSSGTPTIATAGATFVTGTQWGTWNGALVVACLKASKLETFFLDEPGNVVGQQSSVTTFGRLRTPVQGPDGNLYVTTSVGGGNDRILRVVPS